MVSRKIENEYGESCAKFSVTSMENYVKYTIVLPQYDIYLYSQRSFDRINDSAEVISMKMYKRAIARKFLCLTP